MNVIPCTAWVKKGVAATVPDKVELTPKELEEIIKQTHTQLQGIDNSSDEESDDEDTQQDNKIESPMRTSNDDDEFNFDQYDKESGNIHCNIANIATFGADGEDPLITKNDDDSDIEDDIIKSDDNLILIGHVEGDASILEVFVYNEVEGSFYCHHDILLPSFPLCIEWLNFDPTHPKPCNLCAIGNMTPIIDIWDLDVIDCLEPAYKLGCKQNKKKDQKRVGHKDAVLDLAWNENFTHVLASGSVDETVLLWDLDIGKPVKKLKEFNEKVQSLQWHPKETHHLLTGCADKLVRLFDCRQKSITNSWKASGEVERVLWNHYDANYCIVSTDNGYIQYIDVRNKKPIWEIAAHEKEVTGLSLSSSCPGLLISSANDGVIKVWDIRDVEPSLVWQNKTKLGALQCLAPNPDSPFVFAVGGDNKSNNFKVFDFSGISEVQIRFQVEQETEPEFMDVTEDMESMIINPSTSSAMVNKKKKKKSGQ